jgi:predicted AAA+ superfamily ATPase
MKQLFEMACHYSGQMISLNKVLGQLNDAGNTTTLSHYLSLLDTAGLVKGL